ncbi:MAG: protease modulator HflK [Candidatus Omnitrophica bacterium]|nr:protease modulator HflK [Candidatus Omnitrophota bacterium]MBU1047671.1 protease modulator HflK [Candidatus Omnitrophota bacterium]MBU1631512.1 protease modulator HflK [Candidatus Omnitrophota bacterium]MBU1767327.1 protease modulator HflK [Candidatus Omnitrophota bacterium]MBU1888599.1 protease modulator HflK [Candidatus Omnitrophota bacterium]
MENKEYQQPAFEYLAKALRLSFNALKIIVGGLVLYYIAFSGLFTVKQDEVAVILRWGRIVGVGEGRVLEPGFHWSFPEPVDKIIRIPARKVKSLGVSDFWSADLDNPQIAAPESFIPYLHGYCISGDNNLIHTRLQVSYNITEPISYIVNVKDEEELIKSVVSNAVIEAIGNSSVEEALRTQLEKISRLIRYKAQERLNSLDSGITISTISLERSTPPLRVVEAFNRVLRAEQVKSTRINEGRTYANRVINTARGDASIILSEAQTYRNTVVNETLADATYIQELTQKFKKGSKELETYLSYFYQEKMEALLINLEDKFILQTPVGGKENELRILLGKETKWEGVK